MSVSKNPRLPFSTFDLAARWILLTPKTPRYEVRPPRLIVHGACIWDMLSAVSTSGEGRCNPIKSCREDQMSVGQNLLLLSMLAVVLNPASAQQGASAAGQTSAGPKSIASVPDFSGIWRHGSLPAFVPPASGPGPVTNRSRRKDNGVSDYGQLVGDYTNPILQPWAAEVVKKKGELSLAGVTYPNPANQCWPEPVPFIFKHMAIQMLQRPDEIVMLFNEDHEVRFVRMNQPHPAKVKPSYHGDAVGHYEGDTLVIDTVGIKADRPYAMVDLFGTPYTDKLHVVERYRLLDREDAKDVLARAAKELWRPAGPFPPDPDYMDKFLRVDLTVEDEGAYTTPWTASVVYVRDHLEWPEVVCAENPAGFHNDKEIGIPHATKADF